MDLKTAAAKLREEDFLTEPGAVLLIALEQIERIALEQRQAVDAFQAKIPALVNDEIDAAILRLDNNEAPFGILQKLNAVAGKLERNAAVAHQKSLAAIAEQIEAEMPLLIDRALIKNSSRIEAFLEQKIDEIIAKRVLNA